MGFTATIDIPTQVIGHTPFYLDLAQDTAGGHLWCFNDSPYNLQFTFTDGETVALPAQMVRALRLQRDPNLRIDVLSKVNFTNPPATALYLEHIAQGGRAGDPIPLIRSAMVTGNLSSSVISIANDGNVVNTSIVEGTQQGGPASNVLLDNSGNFQLNDWSGTLKTALLRVVAGATGSGTTASLILGSLTRNVYAPGAMIIDGTLTVNNPVYAQAQLFVTGTSTLGALSATVTTVTALTASGATDVQALTAHGASSLAALTASGATDVQALTVHGATNVVGLTASGATDLQALTAHGVSTLAAVAATTVAASSTVQGTRLIGTIGLNASGAAFPGAGMLAGDRFYRTDLGMGFVYDGAKWLSEQTFTLAWSRFDAVQGYAANGAYFGAVGFVPSGLVPYQVSVTFLINVNTTNNATNYWTIALNNMDAGGNIQGALTSYATSADVAGAWIRQPVALGNRGAVDRMYSVSFTKTGTPGVVFVIADYQYRWTP